MLEKVGRTKRIFVTEGGQPYIMFHGHRIYEKSTHRLHDSLPVFLYIGCSRNSWRWNGACTGLCKDCSWCVVLYLVISEDLNHVQLFRSTNNLDLTKDEFNSIIKTAFNTHKKNLEVNFNAEW